MSQITPKITVYIPSHNYGRYLREAIESVLRQSMHDWELLVIDDNSSDNTREIMELYQGDPRIRLFHTEGVGLHAVCNLALRESRGRYLVRLDGDDIFDENILLVLSNHLDKNPNLALVFPDYYLIDEFGEIFAHERREKIYDSNHLLDVPPNGACTMMRVKVLEEVGGYDDKMHAQDGYYIWNKIIRSHKCANVNLPLFFYRRHDRNLTNKSRHILEARREVKKEAILGELKHHKPFIAVIPCRSHYDYVEDLWEKQINNKTLLERSIDNCLRSEIFDHVVVACDNPRTEEVTKKYKDPRLSFQLRSMQETIRSHSVVPSLERIAKQFDPEYQGVIVLSYVQAVFVAKETLEEAVFTLVINDADCSFGVEEINLPLYRRSSFGMEPINPPKGVSTDFDTVYAQTNTVLATKTQNVKTGSLTGPKVANFIVSKNEVLFVDSEKNFQIASIIDTRKKLFDV